MKFIVDFETDDDFESEEGQEQAYAEFIFDALDSAGTSVKVERMKENGLKGPFHRIWCCTSLQTI